MKIFSVKSKNTLYLMQDVIIYSIIVVAVESFLYYYLFDEDEKLFLFITFLTTPVYLGTVLIPALILYYNYLKYNKKTNLAFEEEIIIINENRIKLDSIDKIIIIATYQHFSGHKGATSLPYNDYFYYIKLSTIEGKDFYLTSLLGYELDKEFKKHYPNLTFCNQIRSFPKIQ